MYYLLADLHLLDTVQGLVIAEFSRELPFVVLLLWLAMQSLSRDVLAAAELDAGKGLRYLLRILVPLSVAGGRRGVPVGVCFQLERVRAALPGHVDVGPADRADGSGQFYRHFGHRIQSA